MTQPVAIVTGGASGIGAATARQLSATGWRVAVAGRRDGPLRAVAGEIDGLAIQADVSVQGDVERLVAEVLAAYGRLDGLVLNAGITSSAAVGDLTLDDWHSVMSVNLTGPFLLTRASLPHLLESRGAIVGVASIGAFVAGPSSAAYGASKAALIRLLRSVAVDYGADGVRANAVNPGWIRSEMADADMDELAAARSIDRDAAYELVTRHVPAHRAGTTDEAAAAIVWLLSPAAGYVNGAVVTVDGGTSIVSAGTLAFSPMTA